MHPACPGGCMRLPPPQRLPLALLTRSSATLPGSARRLRQPGIQVAGSSLPLTPAGVLAHLPSSSSGSRTRRWRADSCFSRNPSWEKNGVLAVSFLHLLQIGLADYQLTDADCRHWRTNTTVSFGECNTVKLGPAALCPSCWLLRLLSFTLEEAAK